MSGRETLANVARGAAVVVGAALLVVVAAVAGAVVIDGATTRTISADEDEPTDGAPVEFAPSVVVAEPIPSTGEVTINESLYAESVGERRVVVIERGNTVDRERVRVFVRAVVRAGHRVRMRDGDPLESALEGADAYVRVDPDNALSEAEIDAVRNFTEQGGRVLILGEPNRKRIVLSLFGASISEIRTRTTGLAAEFGIVFESRYLYDTKRNDGNFKNVLARPTSATDAPDLDRVAFDTATAVTVRSGINVSRNATANGNATGNATANGNATNASAPVPSGRVILRTLPSARLDNGGVQAAYPVAVRTEHVLAVGDTSFMAAGRHNIADNERLLGYMVEFALRGDRPANATLTDEPPDGTSGGTSETAGP